MLAEGNPTLVYALDSLQLLADIAGSFLVANQQPHLEKEASILPQSKLPIASTSAIRVCLWKAVPGLQSNWHTTVEILTIV